MPYNTCNGCKRSYPYEDGIECHGCESWSCHSCLTRHRDECICRECYENREIICQSCNESFEKDEIRTCVKCRQAVCLECSREYYADTFCLECRSDNYSLETTSKEKLLTLITKALDSNIVFDLSRFYKDRNTIEYLIEKGKIDWEKLYDCKLPVTNYFLSQFDKGSLPWRKICMTSYFQVELRRQLLSKQFEKDSSVLDWSILCNLTDDFTKTLVRKQFERDSTILDWKVLCRTYEYNDLVRKQYKIDSSVFDWDAILNNSALYDLTKEQIAKDISVFNLDWNKMLRHTPLFNNIIMKQIDIDSSVFDWKFICENAKLFMDIIEKQMTKDPSILCKSMISILMSNKDFLQKQFKNSHLFDWKYIMNKRHELFYKNLILKQFEKDSSLFDWNFICENYKDFHEMINKQYLKNPELLNWETICLHPVLFEDIINKQYKSDKSKLPIHNLPKGIILQDKDWTTISVNCQEEENYKLLLEQIDIDGTVIDWDIITKLYFM